MKSWEDEAFIPFDDNQVERLAQCYYLTDWKEGYFLAVLVMRYMEKFFQEQGVEFACWKPRCFYGETFDEDMFYEDFYYSYNNEMMDLFFYTLNTLKWNSLWFPLESEYEEFQEFTSDNIPVDVMQGYLKSIGLKPNEIQLITNDMKFLADAFQYDENSSVVFFWNDKYSKYTGLPEEKRVWLAQHYGRKIFQIDQLTNRIKYPLVSGWSETIADTYEETKYFAFSMGFNGESDIAFDSLDPNWIIWIFILDAALDDVFHLLENEYIVAA